MEQAGLFTSKRRQAEDIHTALVNIEHQRRYNCLCCAGVLCCAWTKLQADPLRAFLSPLPHTGTFSETLTGLHIDAWASDQMYC